MHISDHRTGTRRGGTRHFAGEVWIDELAGPSEDTRLSMLRVYFGPGAHTDWHEHSCGQILHVIHGAGLIQARGEQVRTLRAGDTIVCPAGEWHWHGAAPGAMMTMIAVQEADTGGAVVHWGKPVAATDL